MKSQIIKLIFLMQFTLSGIAQNFISGVYISYKDYQNSKLSYMIDCKSEKHEIYLNEFFNQPYIVVKYKGEKIKLQKDSIYGIRDCQDSLIRFQNEEYFFLAERGQVWIYYKEINIHEGKTPKQQKQFYFSVKGGDKIMQLTIDNIKSVFPNNHILHDLLDAQMKTENDISAYDTFYKTYKINHLINSSINNYSCPLHPRMNGKKGEKCPKCGMDLVK
jgi:hypothetical protein